MGRSDSAAARDESSGIGKKVPTASKPKTVVVDEARKERIEMEKEEGYLANAREKHPVWTNSLKQLKAFDALRKRVNVKEDDWKWDEGSHASQADLVEWKFLVSQRKAYDSENKAAGSGGNGGSGGTAYTQKPKQSANKNKKRKPNSVDKDLGDGGSARDPSGEDSPPAKSKKRQPQSKPARQDDDNDEADDDNQSESRRPRSTGKKRTPSAKSKSAAVEEDPGSSDEGTTLSDNRSPKNKKRSSKSKSEEPEEDSSGSDGPAGGSRLSSGKRRASRRESQRSTRDEDRHSTPETPTEERGGNEPGAVTESEVEEDETEQPEQTRRGLKGNQVYDSIDQHALHRVQAVLCAQKMRGGGLWTTRFALSADTLKVTFTAASELADQGYHSKFMAAILQGAPMKDLTSMFKFAVTEVMRCEYIPFNSSQTCDVLL